MWRKLYVVDFFFFLHLFFTKAEHVFVKKSLLSQQRVMKVMGFVINDGEQFVQWPSVPHWLKHLQNDSNNRHSLGGKFIELVGTPYTAAAFPTKYSKVNSTCVSNILLQTSERHQKTQTDHLVLSHTINVDVSSFFVNIYKMFCLFD